MSGSFNEPSRMLARTIEIHEALGLPNFFTLGELTKTIANHISNRLNTKINIIVEPARLKAKESGKADRLGNTYVVNFDYRLDDDHIIVVILHELGHIYKGDVDQGGLTIARSRHNQTTCCRSRTDQLNKLLPPEQRNYRSEEAENEQWVEFIGTFWEDHLIDNPIQRDMISGVKVWLGA